MDQRKLYISSSMQAWLSRFSKPKRLNYMWSQGDHIMFVKFFANWRTTILIVYIDDLAVTRDDLEEIGQIKGEVEKRVSN